MAVGVNEQLIQPCNLQTILQNGLDFILMRGFTINAHDRFRPGKSDEAPTPIFKRKFITIGRIQPDAA
jgi:hypothetical protein